MIFVLGLTAATFNSADSVLTSLTTSFCVDFLGFEQRQDLSEAARGRIRRRVHTVFAGVLFATLLILRSLASQFAVIDLVLKLASYTYGPLLGLFSLGLATQIRISGKPLPWIAMGAIALCATLDQQSQQWFNGYRFGFELLLLNALLTAMGALLLPECQDPPPPPLRIAGLEHCPSMNPSCHVCRLDGIPVVLDLGLQPCGERLLEPYELGDPEPRQPLRLAFCPRCQILQRADPLADGFPPSSTSSGSPP